MENIEKHSYVLFFPNDYPLDVSEYGIVLDNLNGKYLVEYDTEEGGVDWIDENKIIQVVEKPVIELPKAQCQETDTIQRAKDIVGELKDQDGYEVICVVILELIKLVEKN